MHSIGAKCFSVSTINDPLNGARESNSKHHMSTTAPPSGDDNEEVLLSCRYGDLDDVKQFVNTFGPLPLSDLRDENGNTVLHMAAGNGHIGEPT